MWILTAVGSVHGQQKFAFALEQNRTYNVGRDKSAEIRFESRHVRPKEGQLVVEDWDPNEKDKPPVLRWRVEPKKSGHASKFKTLVGEGSNREDYEVLEVDGQGCFLEVSGAQGIELAEDCWFSTEWQDLTIQWDKLKDEPDDVRDTLRKHCISYTYTFDVDNPPSIVLSPTFKSTMDTNYAVCYGIRILTPEWLTALQHRISACWKKVADSQDSFSLPDEAEFQPPLDPALPNVRNEVDCWLPDPARRTLFAGWAIMALRSKGAPAEKKYLVAMGARWSELDVISKPIKSAIDFAERLKTWLEEVDATVGRKNAVVVHFAGVKEGIMKAGVDWNKVVAATCIHSGVFLASGNIGWGSVRHRGVGAYLEVLAPRPVDVPPAPQEVPASSMPPPPLPETVAAVPSTFPEETVPQKSPEKNASPVKIPSPLKPEPSAKKPLKRRAGKPITTPSFHVIEETPQELVPETEPSESSVEMPAAAQAPPESIPSQVQPPSQTQSGRSRLKRRVGTQASSIQFSEMPIIKDEETPAEIRELYEQTKVETRHPTRSRATSAAPSQASVDVDMEEPEDDFVQKTLKRARAKKETKPLPQSPAPAETRKRAASPLKSSRPTQKPKPAPSQEPTRDEAFLQAVSKAAKSKKAIDEMDREFNQLRIPKTKAIDNKPAWEAPDYRILDDFDEMRGNFIEVVRKDLFRKDKPKESVRIEDGRPNFKKFKKKEIVRRDPLPMVLVGRNEDAEMGEPYWHQSQQKQTQEDSVPLLPKLKRRVLEDEDVPIATAKRRATQATQLTQSQLPFSTSRKTRGVSVTSDVSIASARPSRKGAGKKGGKAPTVIEDSDEEGVNFTPSATGRSLGTGRSAVGRTKASSTKGSSTIVRRRLLADDDDEVITVAKKRRV